MEVPANPPWTVTIFLYADRHMTWENIKNLPASISRRLTDISSGETAFGDAKPMYNKAQADSGFCEMTEFVEDQRDSSGRRTRKNRRRNITWFNPPYSQNVSTNIGRRFRTLISKHFPRNSKLSKVFNTNTLKLSLHTAVLCMGCHFIYNNGGRARFHSLCMR